MNDDREVKEYVRRLLRAETDRISWSDEYKVEISSMIFDIWLE